MLKRFLIAWVLMLTPIGCETAPPEPVRDPVEPLLGTFMVFERFEDGFIESRYYDGRITIERREDEDAGYRSSAEPEVVLRFDPKTWLLEPELDELLSIGTREIVLKSVGSARPPAPFMAPVPIHPRSVVVHAMRGMDLFLVRGAGPSYWADVPTNLPAGVASLEDWGKNQWTYQRKVKAKGSRSERVHGELTHKGKPLDGRRGQIIFTPLGKFMYYGLPNQAGYSSGWLNTTTYDTALFSHDGSFTEAGAADRAALTGVTHTTRGEPVSPDELMMDRKHLKPITADLRKGMTRQQARAAVDQHFSDGGAVRVNGYVDGLDGGLYHEQYSLYTQWGTGGFTVVYLPPITYEPTPPGREPEVLTVDRIILEFFD